MQADHYLTIGAQLGEGPAWIDEALWFVDIKSNTIFRVDTATGTAQRWSTPEHVGWVLPSATHGLIAGLQSGPHRFDPESGAFTRVAEVDAHLPDNRLNDAAVDSAGRIFFGTMDNVETEPNGKVFVLDAGDVRTTAIDPVVITNGPAIAPDGDRLYHVDTLAKTVTAHAIAADGTAGPGTLFLQFGDEHGHPDGASCDAEGGIWIGFFGGWCARRFAPDGTQTDEVRFPVSNVTKVALGGPDGRTAYATTARQGLDAGGLAAQPLAGDVFTFPVRVGAAAVNRANT